MLPIYKFPYKICMQCNILFIIIILRSNDEPYIVYEIESE